jgi:preprotein translocase subunit SecG
MSTIITIVQIIIAALLIIAVMLQSRGDTGTAGLAGQGASFRSKKGLEKVLFYATIVLAVLFASVSIIAIIL